MGMGGGGDKSVALQRRNEQMENDRQARIRAGAGQIDEAFKKFDEPFYADFQDRFLDFYTPQIDQQLGDARSKITTNLVDRGMLESTTGLRSLGRLQDADNVQRTTLANQAVDQSNALKGQVENEKADLFALNEASADPERIGPLVSGAATAFAAPQSFSPLEDIFASVIRSATDFQAARQGNPNPRPLFGQASRAPKAGSAGSGRVVN